MLHHRASPEPVCGGPRPNQCGANVGPDVPQHNQLWKEGTAHVSSCIINSTVVNQA